MGKKAIKWIPVLIAAALLCVGCQKAPEPTPAPTPDPTLAPAVATATPRLYLLTKGSTGTSVRNLQARLIELGYLNGEADGIYGKATENAVRDFQMRNGLKVDGKAGLQTQEKLFYAQDVVAAK